MLTYSEYKEVKKVMQANVDKISKSLNSEFEMYKDKRTGTYNMGIMLGAVRDRYRKARTAHRTAYAELRFFNRTYIKLYGKEYTAERARARMQRQAPDKVPEPQPALVTTTAHIILTDERIKMLCTFEDAKNADAFTSARDQINQDALVARLEAELAGYDKALKLIGLIPE